MIDRYEADDMIAEIIKRADVTLAGRDGPLLPEPREDIRAIRNSALQFRDTLHRYLENPDAYGGSIVHDLRGRLNSVTGFGEMLIDDPNAGLNQTQQQEIDAIYQSGLKLRDYVNTRFRATIARR